MSSAIPNYGEWDFLYANALLEPDRNRLAERITAAEHAINERLEAIAHGPADKRERAALVAALRALDVLRARRSLTPNLQS